MLKVIRIIPRRYSTSTSSLPKAERNPAHKSQIPLAPTIEPKPIDQTPTPLPILEESFPLKREFIQQQESKPISSVELLEPPLPSTPLPLPIAPVPIAEIRRPVGGFRGGLIGFLLGTTLVGTYGYSILWDDFKSSSNLLLSSVEEAKASAEKMNSHVQRIERVEEELKRYIRDTASKKDIETLRSEYKKLFDAAHIDHLALKARSWSIEQDLHALSKRGSNEVRI